MSGILEGTADFMLKNRGQFENKINRLYLNPENLPYIDNNTLKFHILEHLNIILKCNGFMKTLYLHQNVQIFNGPIFSQFYRNKLLHQFYYNTAVNLTDMRDLLHIRHYVDSLSAAEKLKFRLWKWFSSPYIYFMKELRYRDDLEREEWNKLGPLTERSDYMLREYFGELRDYKVELYDRVLKSKYNLWPNQLTPP